VRAAHFPRARAHRRGSRTGHGGARRRRAASTQQASRPAVVQARLHDREVVQAGRLPGPRPTPPPAHPSAAGRAAAARRPAGSRPAAAAGGSPRHPRTLPSSISGRRITASSAQRIDVAAQRELGAGTDGVAVHGHDDGLVEAVAGAGRSAVRTTRRRARSSVVRGRDAWALRSAPAQNERPAPGQEHGPARPGRPRDRAWHGVVVDLFGHGVEPVRAVESNVQDPRVDLRLDEAAPSCVDSLDDRARTLAHPALCRCDRATSAQLAYCGSSAVGDASRLIRRMQAPRRHDPRARWRGAVISRSGRRAWPRRHCAGPSRSPVSAARLLS
jgi:hypothetical protein